jgi:hypothetical protein
MRPRLATVRLQRVVRTHSTPFHERRQSLRWCRSSNTQTWTNDRTIRERLRRQQREPQPKPPNEARCHWPRRRSQRRKTLALPQPTPRPQTQLDRREISGCGPPGCHSADSSASQMSFEAATFECVLTTELSGRPRPPLRIGEHAIYYEHDAPTTIHGPLQRVVRRHHVPRSVPRTPKRRAIRRPLQQLPQMPSPSTAEVARPIPR